MINRRQFTAAATGTAFAGLLGACTSLRAGSPTYPVAYGPLAPDPKGLLDLPAGFSYSVVSCFGDRMDDGLRVPDRFDGMGCFALDAQRVTLVRNHELGLGNLGDGAGAGSALSHLAAYDRTGDGRALPGGTTTLVYNLVTRRVERQHLSLLGTIRNCAGGTTPWGSWLTCEEDVSRVGEDSRVGQDHGWVFEVPAKAEGLVEPKPLKAMGRFNHEAAAIDPRTGIVYLTEDRDDSLLYRFLPAVQADLAQGGRLQALAAAGAADSRNWQGNGFGQGTSRPTRWIDLGDVESPNDDLRQRGAARGATIFARGEGIHFGNDEFFFCCTSGGAAKFGQVMRYRPSHFEGQAGESRTPGVLTNFVESRGPHEYNFGDNLTVAANGHLIVCEDQYTAIVDNHLRGVTPRGHLYTFARLRTQTELAGVCFSPDGSVLFVNAYSPGRTLAITGPWNSFV